MGPQDGPAPNRGKGPLVSVVVPTYNAAHFLPEALDSVLTQSYRRFEVIVIDDGSTDNTAEVLVPYLDKVQFMAEENFGGPARPRNLGVQRSRGELIAFLDSDDVMMPSALEDAVAIFQAAPEISVVWTDFRAIDQEGRITQQSVLADYRDFRLQLHPGPFPDVGIISGQAMFRELIRGVFMGISSVVVRKAALLGVGPFDESLKNSDDREMWLRLARQGFRFAFRDKVQFSYRKHRQSVTRKGWKRYPSVIKGLEKQVPYLEASDREFVLRRINRIRLGYAHGLRKDGQFSQALDAYRRCWTERPSLAALRGLMLTGVFKLVTRP
jgi:glycosyltransferase involved in cell wall biosynthesis